MIVAFLYDFDKTLTTKDMQEYGFIEDLGFEKPADFWKIVDETANTQKMDHIMAYLYEMVHQAKLKGIELTQERLASYGPRVAFYPGVQEWFTRVNEIGKKLDIEVQHYIVSSGLTEIIEATSIASEIKKIYACHFLYEDKIAVWPKLAINYTNKMQYIFRVNKGILDVENDVDLNSFTPVDQRPIPLSNMVYFGDGLTDVPIMKLVKSNGGHSIAVYVEAKRKDAEILAEHGRVDFIAPADYTSEGKLMEIAHKILEHLHYQNNLREVTWKGRQHHD